MVTTPERISSCFAFVFLYKISFRSLQCTDRPAVTVKNSFWITSHIATHLVLVVFVLVLLVGATSSKKA